MKAFSFRLGNVLHLREQEEELWKLRLGQATRVVEEIDAGIQRTHEEERLALGQYRDLRVMHVVQNYILRMQAERKKLQNDRIGAEARRKEMLTAYAQASQKAGILRKLKERQYAEWRLLYLEHQDAILDDLVAARRHQVETASAAHTEV